jgi:hypothetical protein
MRAGRDRIRRGAVVTSTVADAGARLRARIARAGHRTRIRSSVLRTVPAVMARSLCALRRAPAPATVLVATLSIAVLASGGCRRDMQDAPRYDPYEASTFFKDGRASRHLVPGTVARGQLHEDVAFYTGKSTDGFVDALPMPFTRAVLDRGHERYDIYCSPCHDRAGTGGGMIVQRGYKPPPSLHEARLRAKPLGYFFDVMTNGFGVMPRYAPQVPPEDRWAIAAYVRALQLSQHATVADVPEDERGTLGTAPVTAPGASGTGGRQNVQPPIGAGRAPGGAERGAGADAPSVAATEGRGVAD